MSLYTTGLMVATRVTGTTTTSGVVELYDNCNIVILSNISKKVGGVFVSAVFQFSYLTTGFGPAPSDVGKLFDLENVYGQARALTVGVAGDRVGGNYLHIWSEDASNSSHVNVIQIMRNET